VGGREAAGAGAEVVGTCRASVAADPFLKESPVSLVKEIVLPPDAAAVAAATAIAEAEADDEVKEREVVECSGALLVERVGECVLEAGRSSMDMRANESRVCIWEGDCDRGSSL